MDLKQISELFKNHNLTLGSVESFTGGLFAKEITSISGASKFYKGGLVTYATEEKISLLGICEDVVNQYGVVSKQVANEMAINGLKVLNVDVCVSFTGNAGPTAMEGKPVGEIYIGVATRDFSKVYPFNLTGTRNEIQNQAIAISFDFLAKIFN